MVTQQKQKALIRSRVAQKVFETLEGFGLSNRDLGERITSEVIRRWESRSDQGLLPGMEGVVSPPQQPPSPADIRAVVREYLGNRGTTAPVKAEPPALRVVEPSSGFGQQAIPTRREGRKPKPVARSLKPEARKPALRAVKGPKPENGNLGLAANAVTVLEKRYLMRDEQGHVIERPADMFRRVAANIAAAEKMFDPNADVARWEREFYEVMAALDFLPNSPTLANAGRQLQQLSACFVLPVDDSMESIFDAVKYTALIHKSGGGTGFAFSRLRPEGDFVGSTSGVASGPVSFMRAFDTATEVTKQGGMRRGANMGILRVDHPDILKFITSKEDNKSLSNFNISVAVTEEFMRRASAGEDYDLVNPRTKQVVGKFNAKQVFDLIVDMAWRTGDPGVVFLDRINAANPTPHLGEIESTNPCGEQPLLPFESCNLGSINLSLMLKETENRQKVVDWDKLGRTVRIAVRFLDDVIEVNRYPLEQIERMTKGNRKIGLGVMGFADMIILMGIPYDSEEALAIGEQVMRFISQEATEASADLAVERGVFPKFEGSIYDKPGMPRVRNATRTTIAPTGTLSIIADCSSGIEPLYALTFTRNILDGAQLIEVNRHFEAAARQDGFYPDVSGLMQALAQGQCLKGIEGVPDDVKRVFVTAHDIAPEWHVRMQAAFQKYTDNAVSKTVNFRHDATREDIARAYLLAYKEGCKGITIFRDRSKGTQVLATGQPQTGPEADEELANPDTSGPTDGRAEVSLAGPRTTPRDRPKRTQAVIEKVATGCGNLYVSVSRDDQGLAEVFSTLGKAGGCAAGQLEAISRLTSLALRSGVEPGAIVKQLKGIRCPQIAWEEGHAVLSCADAIASVLEKEVATATVGAVHEPPTAAATHHPAQTRGDGSGPSGDLGQCPECSSLLAYQEGCLICHACGYTKCS